MKVEINSLSPSNPRVPGERQCLDGLRMLSFPAVPQTGNPSIQVLFLPPTSSYVREGTGHMVPRSRSSLKGSWECLRKHCDSPASWNCCWGWRAEESRWDAGGTERREADVTRYHKTSKNDRVVPFKCVLLTVFRLYHNKVREERKGELAGRLRPQKCTAGLQLWKAGFNEKIQLGSQLKETGACWVGRGGFPKCLRAEQHTKVLRKMTTEASHGSQATGLNRADTWGWNRNPDLFSLSQLPSLLL